MKLKILLSKGSKFFLIIDFYIELYLLESRNFFFQFIERLRIGIIIIIFIGYIGLFIISLLLVKKGLINRDGILIVKENNDSEIYIVLNNIFKLI